MKFAQLRQTHSFGVLDVASLGIITDLHDLEVAVAESRLYERRSSSNEYLNEILKFWKDYFHNSESKKCFQIPDAHLGTAIEFSHSGLIRIHGSDGDEFCEWLI